MDTIYLTCEQIVLKLEDVRGIQPLFVEHYAQSSTTWFTIGVVALVCVTIIIVALIVKNILNAKCKHEKESKELVNLRKEIEKLKEKIVEKDEVKKKYTEKLSIFLEELSKNEKNSKMSGIGDEACKKYIDFLSDLAKNGSLTYNNLNNGDTAEKD